MSQPLRIDPDSTRDETVIEGVRYANTLFRTLGIAQPGDVLRMLKREGETITLERVHDTGLDDQVAILTKTHFKVGDVIVYRGPELRHEEVQAICDALLLAAAEVNDRLAILLISEDADLYALPEEDARKLYAHLQARFGGGR